MTTPGPNTLAKEDAGMTQGLMAMEGHITAMLRAGTVAETINGQIAHGYKALSSNTFQGKVQDWVAQYQNLMNKFQALADSTTQVNNILNQSEEDAGVSAGSWNMDPLTGSLGGPSTF